MSGGEAGDPSPFDPELVASRYFSPTLILAANADRYLEALGRFLAACAGSRLEM